MGGKTQAMRAAQHEAAVQPTGKRWFVVECLNKQERLARQHLVNQGFEVYLPMRLCPHPKARNPITPFLPRYLFVRFDPSIDQWLCILSTVGVSNIIRKAGGFPQAVPDHWIKALKALEIEGVLHLLARPPKGSGPKKGKETPVFKKGDRVKVVTGMYAGMDGLVEVPHDNDRVTVFLGIVGNAESVLKLTLQIGAVQGADLR